MESTWGVTQGHAVFEVGMEGGLYWIKLVTPAVYSFLIFSYNIQPRYTASVGVHFIFSPNELPSPSRRGVGEG